MVVHEAFQKHADHVNCKASSLVSSNIVKKKQLFIILCHFQSNSSTDDFHVHCLRTKNYIFGQNVDVLLSLFNGMLTKREITIELVLELSLNCIGAQ